MRQKIFLILALLCAVAQGTWAQIPDPTVFDDVWDGRSTSKPEFYSGWFEVNPAYKYYDVVIIKKASELAYVRDNFKSYEKKDILLMANLDMGACGEGVVKADSAFPVDTQPLTEWQAGRTVSQAAVDAFGGIDKCFAAEPIPDGVWARMQGKTYKENPYIGRDDLRHIRALHWDYDNQMHVGEMIVNKRIADRVVGILRQLFDAKYPIQRMLLPDVYGADDETQMRDNNSSSFCYRAIAGSRKLSKHAQGLAVDINTLYNPYYKVRANGTRYIQPATAKAYCNRSWDFPYKIDHNDLCYRLFTKAGFKWGGDWTSCKDYQHFELIE